MWVIHDEGTKRPIHSWSARGNKRSISTVMKIFSVYLMQVESQRLSRQSWVPDIARVVTSATMYSRTWLILIGVHVSVPDTI